MAEQSELHAMRHSMAHVMATAISTIWPEVKLGVGPVVENGFYYDVDIPGETISEEDFKRIEKAMQQVVNQQQSFVQTTMPVDAAIAWAKEQNQPYKEELLNDLKRAGTTVAKDLSAEEMGSVAEGVGEVTDVGFYTNGPFTDLCRGPHVEHTGQIGAFKLLRVAGAYWRGNESNPQMQRVYGVGFKTKQELNDYLQMLQEAKKRDHRKIGKEMDLFTFSDLVGPGLPLYTPRGTVLIEEIKKYLREISQQYEMQLVSIPHLAKLDLYEKSGHAAKFEEELFRVKSHYDQEFILKPVNCPHHTQIYDSKPRSYKELPIRYVEQTMQYRDEKPGQLGGLSRTRGFTVDDGHTFCTVEQIEQEASSLVEIIMDFYKNLEIWGDHWVSLSVRDYDAPENYVGDPEDWDKAEQMLAEVAEKYELRAKRIEGEAAIYGPKLDFMFKDALGRETQLATVQLDFAMPKRFELTYTDSEGEQKTPVMIHRAILGSFERFIMLLIEHTAGKFPIWLAPEQIRIISVNQEEPTLRTVQMIADDAKKAGLRIAVDNDNQSVGKKIRAAEIAKVPYTLVIGEKEVANGVLSPRLRRDIAVMDAQSELHYEQFIQTVVNETKSRVNKSSL